MNAIIENKRYTILSAIDFLYYVETHKFKFINYCELVISREGDILLPFNIGHLDLLWELAKTILGKISEYQYMNNSLYELLTLTKAIAVSYEYQLISDDFYSEEQKQVYNLLVANKLIKDNLLRANPSIYRQEVI